MEAYALAKYIRMSPYKIRRVLTLIRRENAEDAMNKLKFMPGKAAPLVFKVVKSAVANLKQKDASAKENEIYITEAIANEGKTIKRMMPRAQGRANIINKRTSHIKVTVSND
jgi:large subunit ribosomal protein L22